jgi:hypothetical protein
MLREARERRPGKALVCGSSMLPLFWTSCEVFGAEEALVKMVSQPHVYEAFVRRLHEVEWTCTADGAQLLVSTPTHAIGGTTSPVRRTC